MKKHLRAITIDHDEVVHETAYTRMVVRHYTDTEGVPHVWEMISLNTRGPGAVIAAITKDKQIVLERTYRIPLRREVLELPGGCDDIGGEEPRAIAERELKEETGYVVSSTTLLACIPNDPGNSDSETYVFLGLDAQKQSNTLLGAAEMITTVLVPLDALFDYLTKGDISVDPKIWVAFAFLKQRGHIPSA